MAEALLTGVLDKLAAFAINKVVEKFQPLFGIRGEVESLSRELNYIRAFIKDVDRKHVVEERQMQWVKDVIDIAYQIEDAVDIFLLECPQILPSKSSWLKGLAKRTTQLSFLSKFQKEIKRIQGRICEIKRFRETYEINSLGEVAQPDPELKLDPIGDPEVVGFATDIDELVKCLLDQKNRSLAVVSIVGPGGLGKTTLARKVCNSNDVIRSFGNPIWITISQKYDLRDILRQIAKNLNIPSTSSNENELANLIWESLKKRMYLIILDDVWSEVLWVEIAKVLPDMKNGCRVLITTRIANVAKRADTTYDPYELPFLDNNQSLELLLKKAVPKKYQCPNGLTPDMESLAKKFATKCKGLPLALVVLGGLLSIRPYNFHAWNELLHTMSWEDDGSECIKIIATSYEHLPLAKKLCFLYFAAFPEDIKIEAKPLLRIWVAERLIPHEERRTLEETAENFLEDLVQRSLVQVLSRFPDGSIKYCRVHDVLRDLAVQKAKETNFLRICSKPDDWESCSNARRVAIHYSDADEQMGNFANPNVRSLLFFGKSVRDSIEFECSKYRVLRVLGDMKGEVKLQSCRGSPHLRYLQLNTYCTNMESEFGKWIRGMEYLETLDLRSSSHGDLSDWIWQIKTLRHVLVWHFSSARTQGPLASADLRNLLTLRDVTYSDSWEISGLPNILEVRELGIHICTKTIWKCPERKVETLATLLCKLKHVVYLKIKGDVIDLPKLSTGGFPFYENLKSLVLINDYYGHTTDTLVLCDDMLPTHLTELILEGYELESDPMPVLEKLGSLNTLRISGTGKKKNPLQIRCSARGFKQLEVLLLESLMVEEWKIEMGAMPMLKRLCVRYCDCLGVPPELIHIDSLQYLDWVLSPAELVQPCDLTRTNNDAISNVFKERPHLRHWVYDDL